MKLFINFAILVSIFLISLSVFAETIKDDFNDGDFEGWTSYNCTPGIDCGQWSVNDGVLHYKAPIARSVCYLTMGDDNWTDYTISCEARMLDGFWNFSRIMFAARMVKTPGVGHVYYVFGPTPFGDSVGIGIWGGDENFADLKMEMGKWYKLRAEVEGSDHRLFIDDELVVSNHIQSLKSGRLGIGCCGAEVEFDNITITRPDIDDQGSENFAIEPRMKMTISWGNIKSEF